MSAYDVVAVNLETKRVRLIAEGKSEINADAVIMMAVARRGVNEEFFVQVPADTYKDGDTWTGKAKEA